MNNQIRFFAMDYETVVAQTEWTPERTKDCALNLLTEFRKRHPRLAYTIERTGDSKTPNLRKLTRVTIADGEDVYHSREFEEHEVAERLAEIRNKPKWANAIITTQERYG